MEERFTMISITANVDEQSEMQVAALNEFLRNLRSGAEPPAQANAIKPDLEAGESYTSEESDFEREKIRLLRRFRAAGWKIPKDEIRALNKSVFKNVRRAAALYSEKAGYFKPEGNFHVATSKAKEELKKSIEGEKRKVRSNLQVINKNGAHSASLDNDPRKVDPCDQRLLNNRMMRAALAREGFFSDLKAEGVAKLEASMSREERDMALRWLQAVVAFYLDQFTTLEEYFNFFDGIRGYLDNVASITSNATQEAK
jgi:hypothetical protein